VTQLERKNRIRHILINSSRTEDAVTALLEDFRQIERDNNLAAIKQAQVEVGLREQVRKEAMRFAYEDVAKIITDTPGNTYTTDCDHEQLAESVCAKAKELK
jgi:Zn finger protein HypA/HybF involved in hydrogenase expression